MFFTSVFYSSPVLDENKTEWYNLCFRACYVTKKAYIKIILLLTPGYDSFGFGFWGFLESEKLFFPLFAVKYYLGNATMPCKCDAMGQKQGGSQSLITSSKCKNNGFY